MKKSFILIGMLILAALCIYVLSRTHATTHPASAPVQKTPAVFQKEALYTTLVLRSSSPATELAAAVGKENVLAVLRINRIDSANLKKDTAVVIPEDFSVPYEPFPKNIDAARSIPKLVLVSQAIQAAAFYESGTLMRWAPVSSGKKSTPTASKLYFTNWKGKEVISSVSDEWILKWDFNIDNFDGISLHQYELPGYPASHSCVRFFAEDAKWLYDWADQWILSTDGNTKLASGTPVIIFGAYDFSKPAPWKNLPTDPHATTLSEKTLSELVDKNSETIRVEAEKRTTVLSAQ